MLKRQSSGPTLLLLSQICILRDSKAGGQVPGTSIGGQQSSKLAFGWQAVIYPCGRCREVAAVAGIGLTQSRGLYLIAIDKATWVRARPSGGQRGVMWASEVRLLAVGL